MGFLPVSVVQDAPLFWIALLFSGIFGLILGSFATAMICRVPQGESWSIDFDFLKKNKKIKFGRSHCPKCAHVLGGADLVPVLSWLWMKGRCRHCGAAVSSLYPLTEGALFLAAVLNFMFLGWSAEFWFLTAALPFLAALLVIDLRYLILPNQLVLIVGLIGMSRLLAYGFFMPVLTWQEVIIFYISAALLYGGFMWALGWIMTKILRRESLGLGDVKFFAVAGLWLGLTPIAWFFMLSGALGIVLALVWRGVKKDDVFPFGPALIVSFYCLVLFQGSLFQ